MSKQNLKNLSFSEKKERFNEVLPDIIISGRRNISK
jgi:hypothetical protein